MQRFELAPRLAADCAVVTDWPLCQVLLMRDARYPWFILVPRRAGLRELHDLSPDEDAQYRTESRYLSRWIMQTFEADKLNVAALGNVEPQLHIHHIARFVDDAAWPAPVWGAKAPLPYTEDALQQRLQQCQRDLEQATV